MNHLHEHARSNLSVYGQRLAVGDKIKATDVYDSSNGKWELCEQLAGMTLQSSTTVIIRPAPMKVMKGNNLTDYEGQLSSVS